MLARKGKIWTGYMPITTCRDQRPTIADNIDHTIHIWTDYYTEKFKFKLVPEIPHITGLTVERSIPVQYNVDAAFLNKVLSKKRTRSSCGPDSVRYGHLK